MKVGVRLFRELQSRTTKLEGELTAYRDTMVQLANSQGVEVPLFVTADSGGLGEPGSGEKLREWLETVLSRSGQLAVQAEGSNKAGSGRGSGRGRSGKRKKRGTDIEMGD